MSVIFRTLKKLKTESKDPGKSRNRRVHRKIFAFNGVLHSPSSVLLLLIAFTLLGAGSLFGYFQLRDKNGKKVETFSVSKTHIRQSTDTPLNEKIESKREKRLNSAQYSELNSIEYRPPDANEKGVGMNAPDRSAMAKGQFAATKKTTESSHIVSKIQAKQPDKLSTSQDSTAADVGKVFLANAKKNDKIARLVSDIRLEMDHGDKNRMQKLFDELAIIKGQNNSYVLKLKAVWHIRNLEYEDAANLLETVLSKNELDLEAGINMAIVEIKTRKEQNAYRRLEKLQKSYPDSIRLAEILQSLRRLFNGEQARHFSKHDG